LLYLLVDFILFLLEFQQPRVITGRPIHCLSTSVVQSQLSSLHSIPLLLLVKILHAHLLSLGRDELGLVLVRNLIDEITSHGDIGYSYHLNRISRLGLLKGNALVIVETLHLRVVLTNDQQRTHLEGTLLDYHSHGIKSL
jgi:hypothetical protein